jgi:D-alanyl-D-alanine carboxypeptidase/D-alanyl-D-alanine-endopeptidase (penicillin-binding protein 4)
MSRLLSLLWLCLLLPALACANGLKPDDYALWLAPVEGGAPLVEHRAEVPLNPASTMKLVTAWSALQRLGPDYRWRTRFVSNAPLVDGVLQGDLVWIGAGDPRFSEDDLLSLLRDLRRRGIRKIAGKLLLDNSVFRGIGSADNFGGDAERSFTVPPDAHLTGFKVAWLQFYADAGGARAMLDPALPGVSLHARLRDGGEQECPDVRRFVQISQDGSGNVAVEGVVPRACDGARAYVNVLGAGEFAAQSAQALWHELGGEGLSAWAYGGAPANATVLAQHDSGTLASVLVDINKYSNNTMARTVFLTLGAGAPDTPAAAEQAIRQTLAASKLSDQGLVLENGAGLSRRERIPARLLGEILREAARGPYSAELAATLPLSGTDGTLKHRLGQWGPRLRLKTGTLENARALAGYWYAPDGRRYVLVAIVNAPNARALTAALDQTVSEALQRIAAP